MFTQLRWIRSSTGKLTLQHRQLTPTSDASGNLTAFSNRWSEWFNVPVDYQASDLPTKPNAPQPGTWWKSTVTGSVVFVVGPNHDGTRIIVQLNASGETGVWQSMAGFEPDPTRTSWN